MQKLHLKLGMKWIRLGLLVGGMMLAATACSDDSSETDGLSVGDVCEGNMDACPEGSTCIGDLVNGLSPTCRPSCTTDANCSDAYSVCIQNTVCSEGCNPITNEGCKAEGAQCAIYPTTDGATIFTVCEPAGNVATGGSCTAARQCAMGNNCFRNPQTSVQACSKICDMMTGCPTGQACNPLTPDYGICL